MFDFKQETKDKYFNKAAGLLKAEELECFVVDKKIITIIKNEKVKIYVEPFNKKTVSNKELSKAKRLPWFLVINDRYKRTPMGKEKERFEHAYILLDLEEVDK